MKEHKIIELIRDGKHSRALDDLYKGYPAIRKFILSYGGREDDAADIFQEALIIFCQKAAEPQFTLNARISTYLFSVCKYMWKDRLVKENRFTYTDQFDDLTDISELIDKYEEEKKYLYLDTILNTIGDRCRELLQAFYVKKWTMHTIAGEMGFASEASAKNQKYKCLERAKKMAMEQISHSTTEVKS